MPPTNAHGFDSRIPRHMRVQFVVCSRPCSQVFLWVLQFSPLRQFDCSEDIAFIAKGLTSLTQPRNKNNDKKRPVTLVRAMCQKPFRSPFLVVQVSFPLFTLPHLYFTEEKNENIFISVSSQVLPSVFCTFKKDTDKLNLNDPSSCFIKQKVPTYPQRPLYSNIP